jgi:peptidyl-prolyl cis-trans isomerase D
MILDILRKRGQGWLTKGILILLALTFAFGFGFSLSNFGSGGRVAKGTAAEVNGEKISLLDYYRARDSLYRQVRQEQGEIPEGASTFIGITALNQLIELKLMAQKARELGFRVTDEELSEAIRSNPAFQIDGQFIGAEGYRSFVEQAFRESVSEFEKKYREELLAQKLINFIYETARVTDEELFNLYRMQNEKVNIYFVSFSPEDFMGPYSPSEEEVKKYYEEHKSEFRTPELRSIRYINLTPRDFENRVDVSEEEIKSYYDAYQDEFRSEEGEARPLSDVKDEIREKIKKQRGDLIREEFLKNIEERIKNDPLEKIAEENGIEKVNESNPFSFTEKPNDIPPQVIKKAFSVREGEKSFLQSGEKIWVIEVSKIIPEREKRLEEAKEEIREHLKLIKAKEAARAKAEEILNKVKESGGRLEKAEKSLELKVEESGYFSRLDNIPKIGSDEIKLDAFSLDDKNPLASKVYSAGNRFYIISLKEKQGVNAKEFEEKKAELRENELSRRRRTIFFDWIRKLRQEAKIVTNESLFPPPGEYAPKG